MCNIHIQNYAQYVCMYVNCKTQHIYEHQNFTRKLLLRDEVECVKISVRKKKKTKYIQIIELS